MSLLQKKVEPIEHVFPLMMAMMPIIGIGSVVGTALYLHMSDNRPTQVRKDAFKTVFFGSWAQICWAIVMVVLFLL